ncbi:MAG: CvpA family protein [Bacteroidota bacterium]
MSSFDIIVLIVLAGFFIWGFVEGVIRKILSLAGAIIGIILAVRWAHDVGAFVSELIGVGSLAGEIVGFLFIVILTMAVANVLGRFATKISPGLLKLANKIIGGIVGVAEGFLVLSALILVLSIVNIPGKQTQQESRLYQPLKNFTPWLVKATTAFFPETRSFHQSVQKELQRLLELIPKEK